MNVDPAGFWQALIIFVSVAGVAYLYHKNVKDIKVELIMAAVISAIWVSMSGLYFYRDSNFIIFGFNLFTFTAWTAGLVALKEIYEALRSLFPRSKRYIPYGMVVVMYIVLLAALEYVGYNWFQIQLESHYTGLFGLALMHMPLFGIIYYFSIGPILLLITDFFKVK
jgi:hypothetical protein